MAIQKNTNLINPICSIFVTPTSGSELLSGSSRFYKNVKLNSNTWSKVYFTPGSAEFQEKEKSDEPGTIFEQSIKFDFPGEDASNSALLDAFRRPVIVLIKYSNGLYKIIGSPENGAEMAINQKQTGKNNNQEITFSCTSSEKAWWLEIPSGSPLPEGGMAD